MERLQIAPTRRPRRAEYYIAIIGTDSSFKLWSDKSVERPTREGSWMPTPKDGWYGNLYGDGKPRFTQHIFKSPDFDDVTRQVATLAAAAGGCAKLARPLKRGKDGYYQCPLCDEPFAYAGTFATHLRYHGHLPLSMMVVDSPCPQLAARDRLRWGKGLQ